MPKRERVNHEHPVTPYEEQLIRELYEAEKQLAEVREQLADTRQKLVEATVLPDGEMNARGLCPYCLVTGRFLVRFNTSAEPIYLQCQNPRCLAPMRLPTPLS